MSNRNQKSRKKARKERNKLKREDFFTQDKPARKRTPGGLFEAKARRGDAVTLKFQGSGCLVPFEDEKKPERGLTKRTDEYAGILESLEPDGSLDS